LFLLCFSLFAIFFFSVFSLFSISGPPLLSLCFFHLLCSKNSLSFFFGRPLFFFVPLSSLLSFKKCHILYSPSFLLVFIWYF
jgi:hypothetical protein